MELADGGAFVFKAMIPHPTVQDHANTAWFAAVMKDEKRSQLAIGSDDVSEACTFR
jgi:hypothetical protein